MVLSFLRLMIILNLIFLPLFTKAQNFAHKVNINTADVTTLDQALEGIGEKKAQAIVEYREKHGPFKSIYDLAHVTGIGEKTIERNKNNIEVVFPPEEKNSSEKSASSTEQLPKHHNNDDKLKSSSDSESLSKTEQLPKHHNNDDKLKSSSDSESLSKVEEDKEYPK